MKKFEQETGNEDIKTVSERKNYQSNHGGFSAQVAITDGKVILLSFEESCRGAGGGGYSSSPDNSNFNACLKEVFTFMCRHDTEKYKDMLLYIKDTDSEIYESGLSVLQKVKEDFLKKFEF